MGSRSGIGRLDSRALGVYFGDSWNAVDPGDIDEIMASEFQRWVMAILWTAGAVVATLLIYLGRPACSG